MATDNILRVALIQMCPEVLELERNYIYAAQCIREAANRGALLAVLPEYHLTGWLPEDSRFAIEVASAERYIHKYQALAHECKINVVPGTIVVASESDSGPPILLNKTFFISAKGEILGQYTKANLWHPEREYLTSGPNFSRSSLGEGATEIGHKDDEAVQDGIDSCHHSVIQSPIGPVGLLICYDLAFPEAARSLVRDGARLIVIPTFTKSDDPSPAARTYNPNCEALFTQAALISRASENTCAMIFCNVGGPADDGYMGLSQVTMPLIGTVSASFTDSTPGMRIVDVDLKILDVAEENYKIRQDLLKDGFHYCHP